MESAANDALLALGLLRQGRFYTMATGPETIGSIGLMASTKHMTAGEVEVQPVVASAHVGVERLVAELRGEPKKRGVPATVNVLLYRLIDPKVYRSWLFAPRIAHTFAYRLAEDVSEYAIPYMRRLNSLEAIGAEIDVDTAGEESMRACRRAVAFALLGQSSRAQAIVDEELRRIDHRTDLAAELFRMFAGAFSRRFAATSSV